MSFTNRNVLWVMELFKFYGLVVGIVRQMIQGSNVLHKSEYTLGYGIV